MRLLVPLRRILVALLGLLYAQLLRESQRVISPLRILSVSTAPITLWDSNLCRKIEELVVHFHDSNGLTSLVQGVFDDSQVLLPLLEQGQLFS